MKKSTTPYVKSPGLFDPGLVWIFLFFYATPYVKSPGLFDPGAVWIFLFFYATSYVKTPELFDPGSLLYRYDLSASLYTMAGAVSF